MEKNLWPDFQLGEPVVTPATIMKEQAKVFDEQMKGKLQCFVGTSPSPMESSKVKTQMSIYVAELGGYMMRLFSVQYSLTNIFPCTTFNEVTSSTEENITNLEDFKSVLNRELSKPEVVKLIQILYAQVMSM
ncbi:MAG: hypothetical protein KBT06_07760 [Prevotellaceae bacterium]|nr:hypothetical protein [Candidatus Colivivens equi]